MITMIPLQATKAMEGAMCKSALRMCVKQSCVLRGVKTGNTRSAQSAGSPFLKGVSMTILETGKGKFIRTLDDGGYEIAQRTELGEVLLATVSKDCKLNEIVELARILLNKNDVTQ